MKITQYKEYFIEDDENGTVRLLDIDATTINLFPNVLAAKMWIELIVLRTSEMEKVLYYVPFDVEVERKKFEEIIDYRQFLGRHKDGTYELEWVEGRWRGWLLCVEYRKD